MADKLRHELLSALPQPFLARFHLRDYWWLIETIDVETGIVQVDFHGELRPKEFSNIVELIDDAGIPHDPEKFLIPEEPKVKVPSNG